MRTKTLLIAAAALVVGIISSEAQSVYSANVVGYINFNLTNGFNLIANQLDFDGTGTNNNLATVFGTNMPINTVAYAYQPNIAQFVSANYINSKKGAVWNGNTNAVDAALNKGGAVFIDLPTATSIVVVGTVLQQTNIVNFLPGFNMVATQEPISGQIDTNLTYVPSIGDVIYMWNPSTQQYTSANYINSKKGPAWNPSDPVISVGQGVFINTTLTSGWTNGLIVQ
jgi:hypothetical protein